MKTFRQSLHFMLFKFSSRKSPQCVPSRNSLGTKKPPGCVERTIETAKGFCPFRPPPPPWLWVGVSKLRQPKYFLLQTFSALSVRDWQAQCKLNHPKLTQSERENVQDVIVGLTTQEVAPPHVCRPVTSD